MLTIQEVLAQGGSDRWNVNRGGAMAQMNEEYLAAGIRQQIQSLKALSEEIETGPLTQDALAWRIRAVEIQLRRLRTAA